MNTTTNTEMLAAATVSDPRWAAVVARDRKADGRFVYSVRTTGVYCRPSCGARPARPENVRFHATPAAARRAGFRPCKRCKPDEPPLREQQRATGWRACAAHRKRRRSAEPRGPGKPRGVEPVPPAPLVQVRHRPDAQGVRGGAPRAAGARRARPRRDGDRRDLRRRLQLERAFLRGVGRGAGHDARPVSRGRRARARFASPSGECSLGAILVAASERGVCAILMGDDPGRAGA